MNPHLNVGTMGRGLDGFAAKAIAALPNYLAVGSMVSRVDMRFQPAPDWTPGPQPLSEYEVVRLTAARDKRRRKLERYTKTPQAMARRKEMEAEHAAGIPMTYPEPRGDEEGL
jgi:hypothetical protein